MKYRGWRVSHEAKKGHSLRGPKTDPPGENQKNRGTKLTGRELIAVTLLILMIAGYVMLAFGLLAEAFFSKRKTDNHRYFDARLVHLRQLSRS